MSLGLTLANTLRKLELDEIKKIAAQAAADMEKIHKEKSILESLVYNIKLYITDSIETGKVPLYKVYDPYLIRWIRYASQDNADYQAVWYTLTEWATSNDLTITVTHDLGTVTEKRWVNIRALPIENKKCQ